MLELVYYVAASVDGYIAKPDGELDWLAPYEGSDEDYGYAQFYKSVDAVLMGRKTYEKAFPLERGHTPESHAGCSRMAAPRMCLLMWRSPRRVPRWSCQKSHREVLNAYGWWAAVRWPLHSNFMDLSPNI